MTSLWNRGRGEVDVRVAVLVGEDLVVEVRVGVDRAMVVVAVVVRSSGSVTILSVSGLGVVDSMFPVFGVDVVLGGNTSSSVLLGVELAVPISEKTARAKAATEHGHDKDLGGSIRGPRWSSSTCEDGFRFYRFRALGLLL